MESLSVKVNVLAAVVVALSAIDFIVSICLGFHHDKNFFADIVSHFVVLYLKWILRHDLSFSHGILSTFVIFCLHMLVSAFGIFGAMRQNKFFTLLFCIGSLLLACGGIRGLVSGVISLEGPELDVLVLVLECWSLIVGMKLWSLQRSVRLATVQAPVLDFSTRQVH